MHNEARVAYWVGLPLFAVGCWLLLAVFPAYAQNPSIAVTSPNGGECLEVSSAWTVTWSMSGVHHAHVLYSLTGNEADAQELVHAIASQTSKTWIVPSADSNTVRIFIKGHDATEAIIASDVSDGTFSIRPSCAPVPPVISGVSIESIGVDSAVIRWNTDKLSDSRVSFGINPGLYSSEANTRCDGGGNVIGHCVNLTGLAAGTTYYYKAKSRDADTLETLSAEFQFASAAAGNALGRTPPVAPSGLAAAYQKDSSGAAVQLSWIDNSTDELEFRLFERLKTDPWPTLPRITYIPGTVSVRVAAPADSGTFEYRLDACNAAGCTPSNIATVTMGSVGVMVSGTVRFAVLTGGETGMPSSAFISAWSDQGGYAETQAQADGRYALIVTPGTAWHILASRITDGELLRSSEVTLQVSDATVVLDLVLIPAATDLSDPVSVAINPLVANTVSLSDGASLLIPAGAFLGEDGATVSLSVEEQYTGDKAAQVVGLVYDISATEADGDPITVLSGDIVVRLPYSDADVAAFMIEPEDLALAFWNAETNSWQVLADSAVDRVAQTISGNIGHLTRFALVAPADIQPPDPPYGIAVRAVSGGHEISWSNPTYDFHHTKIYRSQTQGALGGLIADYLVKTAYTAAAAANQAYYYTVRAVDLSGNESTNTTQYTAQGPVTAPSPKELGPQTVPVFTAATDSFSPESLQPSYQKHPNGSLLQAAGEERIWIIKNGYKRLVVDPKVLGFYAHLASAPVVHVSKTELDQYKRSAWVRYVNAPNVYEVNDDASKHWLDMSAEDFTETGRRWEGVFIVNKAEADFYQPGPNVAIVK